MIRSLLFIAASRGAASDGIQPPLLPSPRPTHEPCVCSALLRSSASDFTLKWMFAFLGLSTCLEGGEQTGWWDTQLPGPLALCDITKSHFFPCRHVVLQSGTSLSTNRSWELFYDSVSQLVESHKPHIFSRREATSLFHVNRIDSRITSSK